MLLESDARTDARAERGFPPEGGEARRLLLKRIVASSTFARSSRLTDFLRFVCALAEKGRFEDIHEQNIGAAVFGRSPGYDPAADSIVRSHASRLRHRLKQYFEGEGRQEPLVLSIPRGTYIPVFERRPAQALAAGGPAREPGPILPGSAEEAAPAGAGDGPAPARGRDPLRTIAGMRVALAAAAAVILLLGGLLASRAIAARRVQAAARSHPLWGEFVAARPEKTVIVSADSGLVMYQHLTGHPVRLASYLTGEYLKNTDSPFVPAEIVRKFGARRYTPAIDLAVFERLAGIFAPQPGRLSFRYARDLRIADLKEGNAILLGSAESNPWVQLYEPTLNFRFEDDLLHDRARMVNLHPLPGEAAHYDSTPEDAAPTIYGLAAYRSGTKPSRHILILEGQTMAGTQAAVDFLFDDAYLVPFLERIRRRDGSIPDFEVLLRSNSLAGQSLPPEIVAYRAR